MADPTDITSKLTKLQPIGHTPGSLPSETVSLFQHPDWNSPRFDIHIRDYADKDRHLLDRGAVDNATWVAWNLPVGTVVTLTDHHRSWDRNGNRSVGDLDGLGGSVDLVGTGNPESTDLRNCNMNDLVACMFWRTVDLRFGAFEMFEHPNFTGIRNTIFLSEWPSNVKHAMPGWHMNDNMTSVRWHGLTDRQSVKFFEHPDGGMSFDRCIGWSSTKEAGYLPDQGFDDKVSAFAWYPVIPQFEEIHPITLQVDNSGAAQGITSKAQYTNNTGVNQNFTVSLEKTVSETLTVSSSETHVISVKATAAQEAAGGVPGLAQAKFTLSVEVGYENQKTKTEEKSVSTEIKVGSSQEITAQPGGTTVATLLVTVAQIPPTMCQTYATRWYNESIAGAERDEQTHPTAIWKRVEPTYIKISGGIASSTIANVDFHPA